MREMKDNKSIMHFINKIYLAVLIIGLNLSYWSINSYKLTVY